MEKEQLSIIYEKLKKIKSDFQREWKKYPETVKDKEKQWWLPILSVTNHGVLSQVTVHHDFFLSTDYRKLTEIGTRLNDLVKKDSYIESDDKKHPIGRECS